MFYLGQSIAYRYFKSDPKTPAIITGFGLNDSPLVTKVNKDGELEKHVQAYSGDCFPLRKKNKKSPTGRSIYLGKFYKHGYIGMVKLKLPSDEILLEEIKEIQKIIKQED